jgi:putative endopeptidase
MLGELNQNEVYSWGCPIVWSVMPDPKNSKVFRSNIASPQLSLYDYDLYVDNASDSRETQLYKKKFKRKYFKYIEDIFDACLGKNNGLKPSDVWDAEIDILHASECNDIVNDNINGYNPVETNESITKYGLDWQQLALQIGYKKAPHKYICNSLNYIKCIMKVLTKDDAWKSDKWRTYYLFIIYRQLIRFSKKWIHIYFEFNRKFIYGQPIPWPKETYPIIGLSMCFNTFLSEEYIKLDPKQKRIDYAKNMALDLLIVYKRIIKRNTWLSPNAKKHALQKLEHIKLIVGLPDNMRADPILDYNNNTAYLNMRKMALWRTKKFIELDGQSSDIDIPINDWDQFKLVGKQPYIVNAFYTPSENSIYIPLAYLQKPFIDLDERGIEYNLAHVGYTLGHEMSHCLDDLGSQYDYKGNLYNWWTPGDRDIFDKKVKDVIRQYETFAAYDGIKMDASLSTGENLADISGLAICEEYLKDFQHIHDDEIPIRALSYQAFFTYFAIQNQQKIFNDAFNAQLKTNPHPMNKYRTNCPLSRLKLFRSLYNIKEGDKMFWESTDTIW